MTERFDFASFEADMTAALEQSLGHACLHGDITAEEATDYIDAYEDMKAAPLPKHRWDVV